MNEPIMNIHQLRKVRRQLLNYGQNIQDVIELMEDNHVYTVPSDDCTRPDRIRNEIGAYIGRIRKNVRYQADDNTERQKRITAERKARLESTKVAGGGS